jgi:AAA-like domain
MPEGSVSLDSPFYIDRPPIEEECYGAIDRPGALIRIKAPRQMGKSSLMQRVLNHAKQSNQKTAYLNFQSADAEYLDNIDMFLQWFCASVSDELGLDEQLEKYWKGVLGSKNKCTNYFQRYLLTSITEPITLGLDEVDQVFQHPNIAQEFFGLLRAWHEKGKNEPVWQKLRLVIVHSKEVYIPLNINQSPFNVGLPIELPELTLDQVTDLVQRHGLNWSDRETTQLMNIVDGHPYLIRKALYEIASGKLTLDEFAIAAPTEQGIFGDHLRRHLLNLNADPELETAMRSVITSNQAIRLDPTLAFKLRSMGLVELQGNDVEPLCNLYRTYFRDRLGVLK